MLCCDSSCYCVNICAVMAAVVVWTSPVLWWQLLLWSEVVAVGQNLRSISSQAGLQLLNVLVTLTLSHVTTDAITGYEIFSKQLPSQHRRCSHNCCHHSTGDDHTTADITACSAVMSAVVVWWTSPLNISYDEMAAIVVWTSVMWWQLLPCENLLCCGW